MYFSFKSVFEVLPSKPKKSQRPRIFYTHQVGAEANLVQHFCTKKSFEERLNWTLAERHQFD